MSNCITPFFPQGRARPRRAAVARTEAFRLRPKERGRQAQRRDACPAGERNGRAANRLSWTRPASSAACFLPLMTPKRDLEISEKLHGHGRRSFVAPLATPTSPQGDSRHDVGLARIHPTILP